MKTTILYTDGQISLELPEGFLEMTKEEIEAKGGKAAPGQWVARDPDLPMTLNISWKKVPFFGRRMPLPKVITFTRNETKRMLPSFRDPVDETARIAGEEAFGFRYGYSAAGTDHCSVYLLIRKNGTYLAFLCNCRAENFEDQYALFRRILDSVELS